MIRNAFHCTIGAAVVNAEHASTGHQSNVWILLQFVHDVLGPDLACGSCNFAGIRQQAPPESEVLLS